MRTRIRVLAGFSRGRDGGELLSGYPTFLFDSNTYFPPHPAELRRSKVQIFPGL